MKRVINVIAVVIILATVVYCVVQYIAQPGDDIFGKWNPYLEAVFVIAICGEVLLWRIMVFHMLPREQGERGRTVAGETSAGAEHPGKKRTMTRAAVVCMVLSVVGLAVWFTTEAFGYGLPTAKSIFLVDSAVILLAEFLLWYSLIRLFGGGCESALEIIVNSAFAIGACIFLVASGVFCFAEGVCLEFIRKTFSTWCGVRLFAAFLLIWWVVRMSLSTLSESKRCA